MCAKIFLLETDVVIFPVIYRAIALVDSASRRVLIFFLFLEGSTLPFWAKRGRRKRCGDGSCGGSRGSEQIGVFGRI